MASTIWSMYDPRVLVFTEGGKPECSEKNSAHVWRTPGFEPGPHWWETSALTTAPSLLPH